MKLLTLCLAFLLLAAAVASGAPRTGSVEDPRGDTVSGDLHADARSVAVGYEPADGSLTVRLVLWEPLKPSPAPSHAEIADLSFDLGGLTADGACAPADREWDLRFWLKTNSHFPSQGVPDSFTTSVRVVGGHGTIGGRVGTMSADRTEITWTVAADPRLAGRDYQCVSGIAMEYRYPVPPEDRDFVAPFRLHEAPTDPQPVLASVPAPAAPASPVSAGPAAVAAGASEPPAPSSFSLSAAQLRINQRIGQAAIRRLNALQARLDGRPVAASRARAGVGEVTLSSRQLLINQRIYQAGVRRANALEARLRGDGPPRAQAARRGAVRFTVTQLRINQRIAQAAVRRANALAAAV